MAVLISDELLHQLQLDETTLRVEIASILYQKEILSLGQAARMADLDRLAFQKELAKREIYINYSEEDLLDDIQTMKNLRK